VQNEGLPGIDFDSPRQIGLFLGRVDEWVLVVVKQPKELIESYIDAGRLNHPHIERVELDAPRFDLGTNIAVTEKHGMSLSSEVFGFMYVVVCILSNLPSTPGVDGERMEITMDDAVTQYIKAEYGSSMMTTGWMLVVSTAEGALKGAPNGFVMIHNEGLPQHTQLGLLQSGVNSVTHDQMFEWLGQSRPKPPPF
jgi:hypothetical protein